MFPMDGADVSLVKVLFSNPGGVNWNFVPQLPKNSASESPVFAYLQFLAHWTF